MNADALRLMSIFDPRGQTAPQSAAAAAPIAQHPKLRDAVHLNQMFLPSSEPGQTGWHILDPDGKRVMDPKKLMMEEEESGGGAGDGLGGRVVADEGNQADNSEKAEERLADVDGAGESLQPKAEKKDDGDEEGDFAASNKDSLRGVFLPIDAPEEDKDE